MLTIARAAPLFALAIGLSGEPQPVPTCDAVPIWRAGHEVGAVCAGDAEALRLTVIQLDDEWQPTVFDGDEPPDYRPTYLALAREQFAELGADGELAARDRYLELYGVTPAFEVVRARLADDARHRCHDAIDDAPLSAGPERITDQANGRAAETKVAAVRVIQAHLVCDGLLSTVDGSYGWQTREAVATFQRGAMLLPNGIYDTDTREVIERGSRTRDFETALRVLRERIVAATGWIEDGSAGTGPEPVLGHALDAEELWHPRGTAPRSDAAPDRLGPATEAAARALGWSDAETVLASFDALPPRVAVELPPAPYGREEELALDVEIDRGNEDRRPALTVFAQIAGERVALVRWPTTVGGWQREVIDGTIVRRRKLSPRGSAVWRDLFVGPRWLPPDSTPDDELLTTAGDPAAAIRAQLGPSYRSAFGLVAFEQLFVEHGSDEDELIDRGILTHATGNLTSLEDGDSHGCHRLLGRNAIRLAELVLAHHAVVRRGAMPTFYRRVVRGVAIRIDTRGDRIELDPPIPVEVR